MRITHAAAAALLICLPASRGQGTDSRPAASSISGSVVWKTEVPRKRKINPEADPAYRNVPIEDESCLVGEGGRLANAVVSLRPLEGQDVSKGPPQQTPASRARPGADVGEEGGPEVSGASVTMRGGMFRPRVQVMRAGDTLTIANEDGTLANFHSNAARNHTFNVALPRPGRKQLGPSYSANPELLRVKDDVHPWVIAFIHVVDGGEHRVTGSDGAFRFDGLPPGRYRIEVWHESGKKDAREIALAPGKPVRLEVELR